MYTFTELAAFFMIYALTGWCTEVIYATSNSGKFVNRGFLNGPICPIYGVGVTIVILCLTPLQHNILLLFLGSVILTSALEFVTGFILEKLFHQKWWDYSKDPFNVKGYVCLKFSLLWGLACVFVMKIIQPIVLVSIRDMPESLLMTLLLIFYGLLVADISVTVISLLKLNRLLKLTYEIDVLFNKVSETVGEKLSEGTIKGMHDYQEQRSKIDSRNQELIGKVKRKYGKLYKERLKKLSFVHNRLEKAFPSLHVPGLKEINDKLDLLKQEAAKRFHSEK